VKSNIGHTQAAAGVASVMKMVLAMRNELLPQTLHVDEPSPHVDWSQGAVSLLREPVAWPAGARPRRAGVSSFGISGTNAHVILEEPPRDVGSPSAGSPQTPSRSHTSANGASAAAAGPGGARSCGVVPLVLSGRGLEGLRGQAARLGSFLSGAPDADLLDVGSSLLEGRAVLDDRGVVLGGDRGELLRGLEALVAGGAGEGSVRDVGVLRGVARGGKPVFVFAGQGTQWEGMALQLLESTPVFAEQMRLCGEALGQFVDWSLESVLRGEDGAPGLEQIDVVQPVLFAISVSLAALWRAYGVEPGVVIGHSQGEIAAAHVAGGLSLGDAARLIALRSKLLRRLVGKGGIVAVALSETELQERLAPWGGAITVSAVNGPRSTAVAGDPESLQELLAALEGDGVRARLVGATVATHSAQAEPLREELLAMLEGIEPHAGRVPFFSTVTGEFVDTARLDAEYWYRNMREPVRLEQATRALAGEANAFIEVSPHPVLRFALEETLEDMGAAERVGVLGSLQRDEGGLERFLRSLAEAWVVGVPVDWRKFFAGSGTQTVDLPTYAFQRRRYLPEPDSEVGDVTAAGLAATGHPLLGAAVRVAGRDEWLFSRRLGLATHPWISDHAVLGTVLMPGTGFMELAFAAAAQVGCEAVEELTLEAPLVLGEDSVQLQVLIGEANDERQQRHIAIYSCAHGAGDEQSEDVVWVRHASGTLTQAAEETDAALARAAGEAWPPAGAEPVDVEFLYDALAEAGLEYGPMFQGVKTAWRRDGEIFAEVSFDEQHAGAGQPFGVHPALFDAALHAAFVLREDAQRSSDLQLPFSFSGVRLHGEGSAALRVFATTSEGNEVSLVALDGSGAPLLSVRSLVTRPIDPNLLAGARLAASDSLFALGWTEVPTPAGDGPPTRFALLGELELEGLEAERYPDLQALGEALAEGAPAPDVVFVSVPPATAADPVPQAARAGTGATLELLQAWLAQERLAQARLAIVSAGAMAVQEGELPELAVTPMWGLMRSAQTEHPDRFLLVDLDSERRPAGVSWTELCELEEPQLAVRDGKVLAPRLTRVSAPEDASAPSFDAERTVLITGGTSGLGALLARHLAVVHGVRRLLLTSRRGPAAEGAAELVEELAALDCEALVVACDVSDRAQCEALIESIPAAHPLGGVVHAAGVLEDGLVGAMSLEQLERVMRPKVDGAFHLHELTAQMELTEFVLFSSAAGLMGSPGQANYGAGNAFLDALAQYRREQGLAGRSLAWGLWAQESGMKSALGEADLARLGRLGVNALESERGLELFDTTRALEQALIAPVAFDTRVLRTQAQMGMLPALLRGLVRMPARRANSDSLARKLAGVPEAEWESTVLELVQKEVAAVLGFDSVREVDPQATFTDLGFDSLGAVELRNRLAQLTGLRLPATLVFDYPTPVRVAAHLLEEAVRSGAKAEPPVDADMDRLQARLETLGSEESERARVAARLRAMLDELQAPASEEGATVAERIQSASAEEVLEFIDRELETY
jgi:acyl transferase domain-containing protein/acyl carrier protein